MRYRTAETELNGLNTEKTNIETQLLQECEMKMPELKQALSDSMNNYNQAKNNIESKKVMVGVALDFCCMDSNMP